jgi:hypothetical protein
MTEILVDGKSVPDGITNDNGLRIGIAWHRNSCAQVTISNKREIPHKFQRSWICEGEIEEVAGIKVEHKATEQNG